MVQGILGCSWTICYFSVIFNITNDMFSRQLLLWIQNNIIIILVMSLAVAIVVGELMPVVSTAMVMIVSLLITGYFVKLRNDFIEAIWHLSNIRMSFVGSLIAIHGRNRYPNESLFWTNLIPTMIIYGFILFGLFIWLWYDRWLDIWFCCDLWILN